MTNIVQAEGILPLCRKGREMSNSKNRSIYDAYGYSVQNGYQQYGRYEPARDGEGTEFVGYGRYIAIEMLSRDLDGGASVVTIGYDTLDGDREYIDICRELLGKKKEVQAMLLSGDADVYDTSLNVLMNCLRVSEVTAKRGWCFHRTGWIVENVGSEDVSLAFKGCTLISDTSDGQQVDYVGPYDIGSKGSYAKWKEMVCQHVIGNAALEIAVLIGLSAIISSEWGSRNLLFHFMGDSGTGKTSSAILALSAVGCPNPAETRKRFGADGKPLRSLMSSWKGTPNALISKLDGIDGTLMVFDELSKVESTDILTSTLYSLSDGADKDRMMNSVEMQATNLIRTNILSVGEESLLEKANNQNAGLSVRVCEISAKFTNGPEQAEAIVACCYENYGHAGVRFTKHIVKHMSYENVANLRKQNLEEYTNALVTAGCVSVTVRRLAEFGAILLTVADIAKDALDIAFSRGTITDFLVEQQINADRNTDIGERALEALRGYINANIGRFITDGTNVWNKSVLCLGKIENPSDCSMKVSILASEFPKIVDGLGFKNSSLILKKFKEAGWLEYESGKNYRKRRITSSGGAVRVIVVRFP